MYTKDRIPIELQNNPHLTPEDIALKYNVSIKYVKGLVNKWRKQ